MDLSKTSPRSPREKLAGYVHLLRMMDKCLASLAGTEGDYIYPCPMDQRLLDFTGITAEQFSKAVSGKESKPAPEKPAVKSPFNKTELEAFRHWLLERRSPWSPDHQR